MHDEDCSTTVGLKQLLPYVGQVGKLLLCNSVMVNAETNCVPAAVVFVLQCGQATLEQLLPYLGPAEELQVQFKATHQKLLREVDELKMTNLDAEGGHTCRL